VEVSGGKKGRVPANSVYSYFTNGKSEEDDSGAAKSTPIFSFDSTESSGAGTCCNGGKKASHIENKIGFQRDKALESFLSALNPDSMQYENAVASSITEHYGNCPVCDTEMFVNETFLDCPECGYRDMILVDSEKPSYKDPPRESSYYAYKRINHFKELLAQFQAKETKDIKPEIIEAIESQLHKEQITDFKNLKPSKLREVLKKLKLNRLYDNISHIINRLNKNNAPVMDRDTEERLRHMFIEIQPSFQRHCPKNRRNFLSYSYVLYKFCELLELDDFLKCFPLLKNRDKLYLQDKVWQQICADMNWEFIRSI
jgi:Zn finger protein HypA/HybF involved in hydrogenase expression